MSTEHALTHDWEAVRRKMYAEKAAAISDCLDHLSDVEHMLEQEDQVLYTTTGSTPVTQEIRALASRLRSLRGDFQHHAG